MADLARGEQIGRYTLEDVAGRGGMGIVYRARQHRPERVVALKVISPELADDPAFAKRFERESDIAASIEHPNVIPVYEVDEHEGLLYIVMRYVEGTDLRQLIQRDGKLDPRRTTGLIAQVADALDAAHARGLVHRDIKPANVLVTGVPPREHCYLTDFGLSKQVASDSSITQSGVVLGTIDYLAPEQIMGGGVSARTDVYALGCVLYDALTGDVPYPRLESMATLYAHVHEPPPQLPPGCGVPAAFQPVIDRAMAKSPPARYASAGELARAAAGAVDHKPLPAQAPPRDDGPTAPRAPSVPPPAPPASSAIPPPPRPAPPTHSTPAPQSYVTPAHPTYVTPAPAREPAERSAGATRRLPAWGSRAVGFMIDLMIMATICISVGIVAGLTAQAAGAGDQGADDVGVGAFFVAYLTVVLLYGGLLMRRPGGHNGQTIGHQAAGVRVVRDDGRPVDFGGGVLREGLSKWILFAGIGALFLIPALLDFLWPLWDSERRALHDRMASTHVVRA